jgi:putative toxin-antitoxin system antitoxin component (TIGR02293 family)
MNAGHMQIGTWLGLQTPATETEILRIVEGRLAPSVIKRLLIQHRRSRREKLTLEESDRVLRIVRILSSAEAVYGNRARALAWLRKPHSRLDGRSPLSLLKTDTGSRIVEELLIQIDEGMFV